MPLTLQMTNKWESWKLKLLGFVECTLPHDKVMNVFFNTMIMLKTNFKKFSGNSKEDTFKSSSTMKVVEQESIKQGNSEQSAQTFKVS